MPAPPPHGTRSVGAGARQSTSAMSTIRNLHPTRDALQTPTHQWLQGIA
jgi:hypothetical protein